MLLGVGAGLAADPTALFDEANRLFERGQYAEAMAAYNQLLKTGRASAALYFNLGNAAYKAGQIGQAIVYYRQAERLDPRDPDVQANLRFTRTAVQGGPPSAPPLWRRALPRLTLDRWTRLAVGLFWICLGVLAAMQVRPAWQPPLRRWAAMAGIACALAAFGGYLTWRDQCATRHAVVIQRDAVLRHGPLDESPSLQTLRDGQELVVLDEKDGWLQVAGASRGVGWLKRDQVATLSP